MFGPVVAAAGGTLNLDWLGPVVTTAGVVIVGAITGVSAIIRRRQDRQESLEDKIIDKEPSEKDGWAEVREARAEATKYYKLYRAFEDMYYAVASALRHLARSVHDAHPEKALGKDVVDALAIKPPDLDEK
jgi:hypothetical protein